MRVRLALWVIGLGLLSPGCALVTDATHLVTYEAARSLSDVHERARNRKWASAAWDEVQQADPGHPYSEEYAQGFKDGFEEYLYRGGTGEPPPMAPSCYRSLRYQTPQGYQAVEDWFTGFRHGAAVAQQGGYRRWVTGPSSLGSPGPVLGPPHEGVSEPLSGPAGPAVPAGPPLSVPDREAEEGVRSPTGEGQPRPSVFTAKFKVGLEPPEWMKNSWWKWW